MEELELKKGDSGNYYEYRGCILPYEITTKQKHDEYDFFDMNPAALHGGTQIIESIKIGELNTSIVYDTYNHVSGIKFYARDCEDGNRFEIVMRYYLSLGGEQERVVGEVNAIC